MKASSLELRQAFLCGFLDALDAWEIPSQEYKDRDRRKAWQAGHDHYHRMVRHEQTRLERGVATGEGFPVNFLSES